MCAKALGGISGATTKMLTTIAPRCTSTVDLVAALGLGYGELADECAAAGNPAGDVTGLAICIAKRQRCTSEKLFQLEMPRVGELLGVASIAIPAGSCLTDLGGSGAGEPAVAKALTSCAAAIPKAASAFVAARVDAIGGCAQKLFDCAQRKPDPAALVACTAKAESACARAIDPAGANAELRAAIDARCGEALLAYATLRSDRGANLDGIAGACNREGVTDLDSLGRFESCVVHHHECLAEDLIGTAIPRAPALLAIVGRTLGPTDCPSTGGVQPQ